MSDTQIRFKALIDKLVNENKINIDSFYIIENCPLAKITSFRTGGESFVFVPKSIDAVKNVFPYISRENIKYYVLGNGTNTLAKDEGYDGIIILLTELSEYKVTGEKITCQAGTGFTKLSSVAAENSLTGLEFAYGIPGTVGGAVFMNAGAYDGEISFVLESVKAVFPDGSIKSFSNAECGFGYRKSIFQDADCVVVEADFALKYGNKNEILSVMKDLMSRRKEKQPLEYPSAGSTFKRLSGKYTAKLIDEIGLKGKRIGGAMVSEKHAGFVINYDNAKSADIIELIEFIKKKIKEETGESIQTEIRIIE